MSEEVQTALYKAAQARGIGLISVGHRNSLRWPFHCADSMILLLGIFIPICYNLTALGAGV